MGLCMCVAGICFSVCVCVCTPSRTKWRLCLDHLPVIPNNVKLAFSPPEFVVAALHVQESRREFIQTITRMVTDTVCRFEDVLKLDLTQTVQEQLNTVR